VTTGSIGNSSVVQSTSFTGLGFAKDWAGGDGRYEPFSGGVRDKWNNYTCTISSRLRDRTYRIKTPTGTETLNASVNVPTPVPPFFTANEQQRLLSRLLKQVKDHEFNLAVDLAQYKQTAGMLADNLGHLGRAALYLKRGNIAAAVREFGVEPRSTRLKGRDISGRWLELSYGWLPLIGSCYEAAKAFESISNGPRKKQFVANIWKEEILERGTPTLYSTRYRQKYRRYLTYEMYEELSVERQLGVLDPLSVAWELMPWSFVVDWFIPIGSYLELLMQIPFLQGRFLTTDVVKLTGSEGFVVTTPLGSFHQGFIYQGTVKASTDVYRRTVMSRTLGGPPSVPLPQFDLGGAASLKRFWNALALAHQRFV
jgi:hypothetical protein